MTQATHEVEKYTVSLNLPQSRRYLQTIIDNLLDENKPMESYTLTPRNAQVLQVLLDRIEVVDGPALWNHD